MVSVAGFDDDLNLWILCGEINEVGGARRTG